MKDLGLFAVHCTKIPPSGRFHGEESDDLEQMILDYVTQAACGLVKGAALPYAETLREGDLDAGHVVTIPDRLKEGIGKAEIENIHDRFPPEEVIDAED